MGVSKYIAAAAALLASTAAYAQPGAVAERVVSDPLYLPWQGQLFGETSYAWGDTSENVFNATGVQTSSRTIHSNLITQGFEYGITNNLVFSTSIGYDPSSSERIDTAAASTTRSSSGWTNPEFGITWRALERPYLVMDVGAAYSPNFFSAKDASAADDGLLAEGGESGRGFLRLGREWKRFTIAGTFDAVWDGDRSIEPAGGAGPLERDASAWHYNLKLDTQTRITNRFSFNVGGGYYFDNNYDGTDFAGTAFEHHAGGHTNLNAALNYHFIPDQLVGSITYEHNFYNGSNTDYATAANDTFSRDKDEDLIGVKLRYVTP